MIDDKLLYRHGWADDELLVPSMTISGVLGTDDLRAAHLFGGELLSARWMTFAEAGACESAREPGADGPHLIQLVSVDEYRTVIIEHGIGHGVVLELARRASAEGREFCSVCWTGGGDHQVTYAVDGELDAVFEPMEFVRGDGADSKPRPAPEDLPRWARDVPFRAETVGALSLALFERLLGLSVDPDWLQIPLRTLSVPAADELFAPLSFHTGCHR